MTPNELIDFNARLGTTADILKAHGLEDEADRLRGYGDGLTGQHDPSMERNRAYKNGQAAGSLEC